MPLPFPMISPLEHRPATAALSVRPFEDGNAEAWERFVGAAPDATIFHGLGWQRAVSKSLGHTTYLRCAWREQDLVGVLPLTHIKSRLFGNSLVSAGFGVYGGILAADAEAARALADDAAALATALAV